MSTANNNKSNGISLLFGSSRNEGQQQQQQPYVALIDKEDATAEQEQPIPPPSSPPPPPPSDGDLWQNLLDQPITPLPTTTNNNNDEITNSAEENANASSSNQRGWLSFLPSNQENDSDDNEDQFQDVNNNNNSSSSREDQENSNQKTLLSLLGRPYASTSDFWTTTWPLSLVLGAWMGVLTFVFLLLLHLLLSTWTPHVTINAASNNTTMTLLEFTQQQHNFHGHWFWMAITTSGGFLSALLLVIAPSHWAIPLPGAIPTLFHDTAEIKGHPVQSIFIVLSSLAALATGAPLGPEMVLGTMATASATALVRLLSRLSGQDDDDSNHNYDYRHRRIEASLILCTMAAALGGCLLPSPILGVVLVHELSLISRPLDYMLDSLLARQAKVSREALSNNNNNEEPNHDFMEQVTLGTTAAMAAYIILYWLGPSRHLYGAFEPQSNGNGTAMMLGDNNNNDEFAMLRNELQKERFELWHLAAAIPLGLLCGFVGTLALVLNGVFRQIRRVLSQALGQILPSRVVCLLFPTLAGALHGLLSIWNPLLLASGSQYLMPLLLANNIGTWQLFLTAFFKIFSMSLCLGFGLPGGPLLPVIFSGVLVGKAVAQLTSCPLLLAIPSCVCATAGSFVPLPMTWIFTMGTILTLSPTTNVTAHLGPALVATCIAFTCTGGLGILQRLGRRRLEGGSPLLRQLRRQDEEHERLLLAQGDGTF